MQDTGQGKRHSHPHIHDTATVQVLPSCTQEASNSLCCTHNARPDQALMAAIQHHLKTVLHTFTYQAMPSRWQTKGYSTCVEISCGQAVGPQVSGHGGESECGIHGHNCIRHPIQSNAAMQRNVQFYGQSYRHHDLGHSPSAGVATCQRVSITQAPGRNMRPQRPPQDPRFMLPDLLGPGPQTV